MKHDSAERLVVAPNETGVKRKQAEFLLITQLADMETASKRTLKRAVKRVSQRAADQSEEPPIYFGNTTGRTEHQSREFNEVLSRCLERGWIESLVDGDYGITDDGLEHVNNLESDPAYDIDAVTKLL